MTAYSGENSGMIQTAKMTEDELNGMMARYRLNMPDLVGLLWAKTGTFIKPDQIRTALARQGSLSAPLTAALRLLELEIRRTYEGPKN